MSGVNRRRMEPLQEPSVPIDYENMLQYVTPFRCPECSEHTFQTDAKLSSPSALIEAECTNCGHALTREEIDAQVANLPADAIQTMVAKYKHLR